MADERPRDMSKAVRRGAAGRCPNCGTGKLYAGFLRLRDSCANCGTSIRRHRTAAGPAFLTVAIASILIVPTLGIAAAILGPDPVVLALVGLLTLPLLSVLILRVVKGAMVGYLWAIDFRSTSASPD